jgi:hypothetical protein
MVASVPRDVVLPSATDLDQRFRMLLLNRAPGIDRGTTLCVAA